MRLVMSFAVLQTAFFYLFAKSFPDGELFLGKFKYWYALVVSIGLVITLSPLMFSGVVYDLATKTYSPKVAPGMIIFLIVAVGSVVAGFIELVKKYLKAERNTKDQIRFLFIGLVSMFMMMIVFNLILPIVFKINNFVYFGTYYVLPFVGFTTYSIVSKKLFDLKLILTETATIIVVIALAAQTFMSKSFSQWMVNGFILLLVTYGGIILIKSVRDEINRLKQIQKLAKDLEAANDHLEELDKVKDDFLSMASHELNTPIAAIEGYLSMILVEKLAGVIPPKAKTYLDSVYASSQRLAHLVRDLLNVSRIESGRIHLLYEQKPIEDIINQAIMEISPKVREAKHTLTFEKSAQPLPITWLDVTRITEIMINIIGNAIKYTDPGGKITVKAMSDDQIIVVSVEDNGRGIPQERQDAIFEKFTQADTLKDQAKGTGLGMYISKKFIELHKGKIWFHSEGEGKGTTFFISLPIVKDKPIDEHEGEGPVLH